MFSGPAIAGQDPRDTAAEQCYDWSRRLAAQQAGDQELTLGGKDAPGILVRRAEFISVHGGGGTGAHGVGIISDLEEQVEKNVTLCYVLPTTIRGN